jgi:hypothetical protein
MRPGDLDLYGYLCGRDARGPGKSLDEWGRFSFSDHEAASVI